MCDESKIFAASNLPPDTEHSVMKITCAGPILYVFALYLGILPTGLLLYCRSGSPEHQLAAESTTCFTAV